MKEPIEIEHELFTRTRKTQRSSWTALAHHKEGGEGSYVFLLIYAKLSQLKRYIHYRSFHGFSIDPNVQVIPSYTMKTKGIFSKSCIYTYRYIPTIIRTKNGI